MKFLLHIISIGVLAFILGQFLPWWTVAIAALLVSYFMQQKEGASFLAGFLAIFLFWGIYAFSLNQSNDGLLAGKMGELFGGLSPMLLVLISAIIGGLLGGLGAWSGVLARKLF